MDNWVARAIGPLTDRWSSLDADWQGLYVGTTVVALIVGFGITVPW